MNKSWRPEGWKNPHTEHLLDLDFLGNPSIANKIRWEEFEAGADAMLKAMFELAKGSPTGKFEIDSNVVQIYGVKDE